MEAFVVSAPGKVIVFGEHAVVHGKAAIAASVALRSYLMVSPSADETALVTLDFPDVKMHHTWCIKDLPWSDFAHSTKCKSHEDRVTALDEDLKETLRSHIDSVSPSLPESIRSVHKAASSAFLYILLSLSTSDMPSTLYTLRSTIPIGAGLGSSASVSVCLATAVLHQNKRLSGPEPQQSHVEREEMLELINRWAFVGELCIHGNPSGIDNTVATRGRAVLFRRTKPGQLPDVKSIENFPVLPLLLVDTKQSRSTAVEVAKVGKLRGTLPEVTNLMLDAIDKVTEAAYGLLTAADFDTKDPATVQRVGEMVRVNHGLLVALGVSHPKLERIRELIDHVDIGYTKLTGAGGGGCAITLLKPDGPSDLLHKLEVDLKNEGYAEYKTLLGGPGVGFLEPAVVNGQEISREIMLKADSSDEIERSVGASEGQADANWRFWTV